MSYILLENRKTLCEQPSSHHFYGKYTRIHCSKPEDVKSCLQNIHAARQSGKYLVGYISYEACYGLTEIIFPSYKNLSNQPLIDFYIFENHQLLTQPEVNYLLKEIDSEYPNSESFIYDLKLNFDLDHYSLCLEKINKHLKDGDTYQVNFTGKYHFQVQGTSIQLYQKLRERQKVEFSALFNCKEVQLLSFSPELFFEKKGSHFRSKPMKGTTPRSSDSILDARNKNRLISDPKTIAENMIIVDLIRNDLSKIAQPTSVHVPMFLEVEEYETIYQMTSTVACEIDKDACFGDILSAIFPCGSITGAPKIKTMQIIRELEKSDRGIYTGAIGYITPDNDMCFNVAIRTLHLNNKKGEMGVGGGIMYDSVIGDEFEEVKMKAAFLTGLETPFNLIECFLYEEKTGFRYVKDHLERMQKSADLFNFKFSSQEILKKLMHLSNNLDSLFQYKIKIVLQKNGDFTLSSEKLNIPNYKIKISNAHLKVSDNILFYHKTDAKSVRGFYNECFLRENTHHDLWDIVFINEHGFITEGSKSNIFIKKNGHILTPAIACGVLPGIMRKKFMAENPQSKEAFLTPEDLMTADTIWMTNSVVGVIEVSLPSS